MRGIPSLMAAITLLSLASSAHAQVPEGSYLRTCTDVRMEGRALVAVCRRADGREQRTVLNEVERCAGDIRNNNGFLQCNRGPVAAPGYPPPPYAPPPPRYGEDREYWERCERWGHDEREIFERLQYTPPGEERERLEHRLREVREAREWCPHR
jgi:hypothetical protein